MAEEKFDESTTNLDDISVLRVLMHTIHGISPVSSLQYELAPIEDETGADVSYAE
ncbi:MAG TPA: hypothetical protein PL051_00070 [Candidatus Saccharibacteria bacterium]|nr:hypothetical protein [Candidatus Saccharibacteria bacterium]